MNDQTNQTAISEDGSNLLNLTSNIVSAFVSNTHTHISAEMLNSVLKSTYATLAGLSGAPETSPEVAPVAKKEPAVSIRSSIKPGYLVCLEDGAKLTMLKRYLRTNFNLTPDEYRAKWGLASDYPMVAPDYSEKRRQLAVKIGLGSKGRTKAAAPAVAEEAPKKRGRKPADASAPAAKRGRKPAAEHAQAA